MLSSPYIDDLYITLKLNVENPYITINPLGNQEIGIPFTISGTTNLAAGNQLLVEISSTSFVPGDKNQQTSASGVSGTVIVFSGSQNGWSYLVSCSGRAPDSYTVCVSGISVSTSASASLNVVSSPVVPPQVPVPTTPAPVPTQVPTGPQLIPLDVGLVLPAAFTAAVVLRRH